MSEAPWRPFKPVPQKESSIENGLVAWCQQHGIDFIKMQKRRDWPDRFILLPARQIVWIELKRKGGKPTKAQRHNHDYLRSKGHQVEVCDSRESAIRAILAAVEAARVSEEGDPIRA